MYKIPKFQNSRIKGDKRVTGETMEQRVERIMSNREPILDSAPRIYTDRKDGVRPEFDIRTDKWEILADNRHAFATAIEAKKAEADTPIIDINSKGGEGQAQPGQ